VRALTRNAKSEKAQALSALQAEVVQGDMAEPASLVPVFEGAYGVFSVQNPMISGVEEKSARARTSPAQPAAGVQHLIYGFNRNGVKGTGIPSWIETGYRGSHEITWAFDCPAQRHSWN
jgi:hypothetical protein